MRGGLCLALGLVALASSTAAFAQTAPQSPTLGNYYDLPDYGYFPPAQVQSVDTTITPQPTTKTSITSSSSTSTTTTMTGGTTTGGTTTTSTATAAPVAPSAPIPSGTAAVPTGSMTGGTMVYPQGDMAAARADAKATATLMRQGAASIPTTTNLAGTVPGYTGATLPQEAYADDPDALVANGSATATASDPYRTVVSPVRPTVTLDPNEFARARAVEDDPNAYTQGQSLGGTAGSCTPLPPGTTGTSYYEATCNVGTQVQQTTQNCAIPLNVSVVTETVNQYICLNYEVTPSPYPEYDCATFDAAPGGICTRVLSYPASCFPGPFGDICIPGIFTVTCTGIGSAQVPTTTTQSRVVESRDESQCQPYATNSNCSLTGEVCTSSDPVTRIIDGVSVTRPCWAWGRTYQCNSFTPASDCSTLVSNPSCSLQSEACLDDPQSGACQVTERTYRCPISGSTPTGTSEFICGGDVFCINGECEPIVREASTEFKDALVGLHTLGQANAEFDEGTLTLFSGTRETCHSKVFGLSNCCSGSGVPLLTPFLCNPAEQQLDIKDDAGLCHKVGTYCSDSVLGVCVTKKTAYCCFASKLTRILQEQGRPQLGIVWLAPKKEQCQGFTIDQFSQLDLSLMDFTEIYSEFVDAARLPDEIQTAQDIQARIQAYYDAHKP